MTNTAHEWNKRSHGAVYENTEYKATCSQFLHVWYNIPYIIKSYPPNATSMHQWIGSALVQIMACCLVGTKPLSEPMPTYYQLDPMEHNSMKFYSKFKYFHSRKYIWSCRLWNGSHFVQGEMSLHSWLFCTDFLVVCHTTITFKSRAETICSAHNTIRYVSRYICHSYLGSRGLWSRPAIRSTALHRQQLPAQ